MIIDVFLVGGGGVGGSGSKDNLATYGTGGGGYTVTGKSIVLTANTAYDVVVGDGGIRAVTGTGDGGNSTAFSITAHGGSAGAGRPANTAGKGGDGGGSGVSGGTNCAGSNIDGITNTGGGGGGNHITQFSGGLTYTFPAAGKGGSGILVIRNAR